MPRPRSTRLSSPLRPSRQARTPAARRVAQHAAALGIALTVALFASGCDRQEPHAYRVAKSDDAKTMGGMPGSAGHAGGASAIPIPADAPRWTTPEGWHAHTPGDMQLAAWAIHDASGDLEVTVATIEGDAGGDLANVNRWRRQLGMPPAAAGEIADLFSPLTTAAGPARLIQLSHGDKGMNVGWLELSGKSWFFKMTGSATAINAARPAFTTWLETLAAPSASLTNPPTATP